MTSKVSLFLLLFAFSAPIFGQEICNNGIDDDADNLIDLNDPDCNCNGTLLLAPSLVPNPSFEDTLCCPGGYDELSCTTGWQSGTSTSSDLFHLCGFNNPTQLNAPLPVPDGGAFAGFINNGSYQEFLGNCLPAPLQAGTAYTLKASVGFGIDVGTAYSAITPFNFTLYGATNCNDLPINTQQLGVNGCPTLVSPNWVNLGSVSLNGFEEWVGATISFTPGQNISAIIIGPDCGTSSPPAYYFVDNVVIAPDADFGGASLLSSGDPCQGTLTLSSAPITNPNVEYQWYKDGVAITGEDGASLLIPSGPGGLYQLRIWDGLCCDTAQQFIPIGNGVVSVDVQGLLEICAGEQTTLDAGPGFATYEWTTPAGIQFGQQLNASTAGTYILRAEDVNQCVVRDTVELIVNPIPQISVNTHDVRCFGERNGSIELTASVAQAPFQYSLDNGNPNNSGSFTSLRAGQFVYLVIDALGCETTGNVNLFEPQLLQLELDQQLDAACDLDNGSATLLASGGTQAYTILWEDNNNLLQRNDLNSGDYFVRLTDANGCQDSLAFQIGNDPRPSASFEIGVEDTADLALSQATVGFLNNSENGFLYQWDFGDGSAPVPSVDPVHTFTEQGRYTITLIAYNRSGELCPDTFALSLNILEDFRLYFPTAFSPNNDGYNDLYRLKGEGIENLNCSVLDRWGQLIHSWNGIDGSWDGTRQGRAVPEGVYTVRVEAISNRGERLQRAQTVTLIR